MVTKIEYAEFQTEADMNLYEIYFINLWKPPLNIDDKCKDELTVHLPDVEWQIFTTPLWDKWKREIAAVDKEYQMRRQEKAAKLEMDRIMRRKWHSREITEEEYYAAFEKYSNATIVNFSYGASDAGKAEVVTNNELEPRQGNIAEDVNVLEIVQETASEFAVKKMETSYF